MEVIVVVVVVVAIVLQSLLSLIFNNKKELCNAKVGLSFFTPY